MQLEADQLHRLLAVLEQSDIQEFQRLEGDETSGFEVRRNLPAPAAASRAQAPLAAKLSTGSRLRPSAGSQGPRRLGSQPPAAPLPCAPIWSRSPRRWWALLLSGGRALDRTVRRFLVLYILGSRNQRRWTSPGLHLEAMKL